MGQSQPPKPKFREQDANGVDLSLIRANLRLTAIERLRRADAAARGYERLRQRLPPLSRMIFERLRAQW